MKRIFLHILILALSWTSSLAQTDSAFADGNKLYSEGKYEEAISRYQNILDQGLESAELYYNMGNAAFRSNKVGYSVLYYKKALRTDPAFEPASQNLKYVSLYLEDKLDSVPELFIKRWVKEFFNIFPLAVWSLISVILFVLLLTSLLVYIFGSILWVKKTGFFVALISIVILVLSLSATIHHHLNVKYPDQAVIIAPSVVVKSTPSDSGTDLFVLHEGTSLTTDDLVGDWTEIKIIDGRVGWVRSKTFEIL
jgi:tetratricopeptide (TPR) repeat protein